MKFGFYTKDFGHATKILGMEIVRDKKLHQLVLSQKVYLEKVLNRFSMENSKPLIVPLVGHFKLATTKCPETDEEKLEM